MTSHQEHAGKSTAHESKRPSDEENEEVAAPSRSEQIRAKLKFAAHYVLLGLAPIIAVVALVVAMFAINGARSSHEQLAQAVAKLDDMNASLIATRSEVDKLKLAMLKDKSMQNEAFAKQGEQIDKIIHNITPLQVKLRISPTLEEQMRPPVSAPVAPVVPHVAAPAAPAPRVVESAPAPRKTPTPAAEEKKMSPQVRAMKEAIEQYNKR